MAEEEHPICPHTVRRIVRELVQNYKTAALSAVRNAEAGDHERAYPKRQLAHGMLLQIQLIKARYLPEDVKDAK